MPDALDSSNPIRILIVDDHPNTAAMLARVLSRFDSPVEVITASSGEDALEKIGDQVVDILITDFMMPGLNGLELIEKLKGEQKPAHTILITAYDTPGLAITARRLNVQDYLVKPVQPEKIRSIVSKVIDELRPQAKTIVEPVKRTFKILIADDYPDNLRLLSTRLQNEGYTFIPAWDGEETLQKTRDEDPDLVLLDVNMPKKDGFEVLAELRADPQISHIPVIMITAARIGPKDVREGLTLGADDYVIKPFDWRELAARIRSKLRVKQAEDILRRRTKELGILPEIGQELSARLNIEELANIVLNRTVEVLGTSSARLDVFLSDGEVFCRERQAYSTEPVTLHENRDQVIMWGLVGHILECRQGIVVDNIGIDNHWRSSLKGAGGSAVAVPLLGRHDVIGVLTMIHDQPGYFTADHLTLLQAIASQAAIAIENAQLLNVEHKRVQELMALNRLSQEINRFTHSRQLLEHLPSLTRETLGYQTVAVWDGLASDPDDSNELRMVNVAGSSADLDPDILVSVPKQAVKKGSAIFISDPSKTPSAIAVPLTLEKQKHGAIALYNLTANAFEESDRALLQTLATHINAALERISLFESVEHEQRRLLAVLRSAADAILVMDSQIRLTLANPAGERLFTDAESRVGEPLPPGQGYDELIDLLDQARTSGTIRQGEVIWPDGRTFSVLVTPVEEGGQVAVLHDVSQFKALAELKNEYIATASHDLKNPIQAVLGFNDLLVKAGPMNPMQEDFSRRIRSSALQMRDLVLNLLEISRLESGAAMKLEMLDLHEMLNEAASELNDQLLAKGHQMSLQLCDQCPQLRGDRTLLQQMVHNLLGNAIKYTPQNGQISLSTNAHDGQVMISFVDNGIGIAAEDLPNIFNKFYRVRNESTQDIEGTGLGLAIVKSIVENHGGHIDVDSQVGQGTTFTVYLPILSKS
jgi:signal transduction histidine kinase/DNA-binding response OmpR family regulator